MKTTTLIWPNCNQIISTMKIRSIFHHVSQLLMVIIATTTIMVTDGSISTAKHCKRADRCALTLIPLTDAKFMSKPPRTPQELNEWCKRVAPQERCLKDFANKCLDKQSKQSLSVMMYSFSRTNKRLCTNKKRRQTFLNLIECGHKELTMFADILKNLTTDFHGILTFKQQNLRIPLGCCSYYKWKNIAATKVIQMCPDNDAAHEEVENLLNGYTNDLLAVVCGDYTEESDKCDKIIQKIPEWKQPLRWNNFIIPLVEIFDSIDDNSAGDEDAGVVSSSQ
ncbi:uncharacterized protein LOC124496374 isoform X1 [Dermatophagoides farinae]|uniref:uncharacterized protein LOC124496374 isoform X1 n=1 Tax=Dermatophagoides farinae TaxID=6954 RepID=UPI003F5FA32F